MSQTEVEGEVSGEWTAEDSPYIVLDSTWIPVDEELRIEAGVVVYFAENTGIDVFGEINAVGNNDQEIEFLPIDNDILWRGINIHGPDTEHSFNCCLFRGVNNAILLGENTTIQIDSCDIISYFNGIGVISEQESEANEITIDQSRILTYGRLPNSGKAIYNRASHLQITNSELIGEFNADSSRCGGALYNGSGGFTEIYDCIFTGRVGSNIFYSRLEAFDSEFYGAFGLGMSNNISNCVFHSDVRGDTFDTEIDNCIFEGAFVSYMINASISRSTFEGAGGKKRITLLAEEYLRIIDCDISASPISLRNNWDGEVDISNCSVSGLTSLQSGDGRININNCSIFNEIRVTSGIDEIGTINIINNTFVLPDHSSPLREGAFDIYNSSTVLINNIVYMPEREETTYIFGSISINEPYHEIRYNCFYGFDEIFMERGGRFDINDSTNVYADPRFVSLDNMDLNLLPDSPCIDVGDPDFPEDPDGTRADIGAYYFDHNVYIVGDPFTVPASSFIVSAFPNPFNSMTTITYTLPIKTSISLSVYDLAGREVVSLIDGEVKTGRHSIVLDSEGLASGIYFVRLVIPGRTVSRKILLVR